MTRCVRPLLIAAAAATAATAAAAPPAAYASCVVLDCATQTTLAWTVSAAEHRLYARLATAAFLPAGASSSFAPLGAGSGWLAVGFSAGGANAMVSSDLNAPSGSDMIIASAAADGSGLVRDCFTPQYAPPQLDPDQDVALEGASSNYSVASGGPFFVDFSRAFVTTESVIGGPDRDLSSGGPAITLLWALNPYAGSISDDGTALLQHLVDMRGAVPAFDLYSAPAGVCDLAMTCAMGDDNSSAALRRSECFGIGWPSAELAGDRDGDAATPRAAAAGGEIDDDGGDSVGTGGRSCLRSPDGVLSVLWSTLGPPGAPLAVPPSTPTFYFTLSSAARGWVAIGFNRGGPVMAGADMIYAFVKAKDGSDTCAGLAACDLYLVDAFSSQHSSPPSDLSQGGTDDATPINASLSAFGISVTFSRPVSTPSDSATDAELGPGASGVYVLWAYGLAPGDAASGAIGQHAATGLGATSGPVNVLSLADACFATGSSSLGVVGVQPKRGGLFAVHGALMVLAFWFWLSLAALAARHRTAIGEPAHDPAPAGAANVDEAVTVVNPVRELARPDQPAAADWSAKRRSAHTPVALWFRCHLGLNMVGVACALAGLIVIELALRRGAEGSAAPAPARWHPHARAGTTALCSLLAQVGVGLSRPAHNSSAPRLRFLWLVLHRALALTSLLAALAAVPLGLRSSGILVGPAVTVVIVHGACALAYLAFVELNLCALGWRACGPRSASVGIGAGAATAAANSDEETEGARMLGTAANSLQSPLPPLPLPPPPLPLKVQPGFGPSLCLRRACFVCTVLVLASLSGLIAAWALLQPPPLPAGVWGGSTWRSSNVSERVEFPLNTGTPVNYCVAMTETPVPPRDTAYLCRGFAFPPGVALHMLRFVPFIDKAQVVHHMILYATTVDVTLQGDARGVFDCESMPPVLGPLVVWAVGSDGLTLPPSVGIRVAANIGSSLGSAYGILQVHYSNPTGLANIVDSSGLLLKVSDALRPIDAGLLELGVAVSGILIPPFRKRFGIAGSCASSITQQLRPASQVNPLTASYVVLANAMHMHTLGRRAWTEQWRAGARIKLPATEGGALTDPLGSSPFYDFGSQRFTDAPQDTTIVPGDALLSRFVFENTPAAGAQGNTRAAAGLPVPGCESTTCEMAFNFVLLYPRLPGTVSLSCVSAPVPFCSSNSSDALPSCDSFL